MLQNVNNGWLLYDRDQLGMKPVHILLLEEKEPL